MFKIIVYMFIGASALFASLESALDNKRFKKSDGVLIDTFSGLV